MKERYRQKWLKILFYFPHTSSFNNILLIMVIRKTTERKGKEVIKQKRYSSPLTLSLFPYFILHPFLCLSSPSFILLHFLCPSPLNLSFSPSFQVLPFLSRSPLPLSFSSSFILLPFLMIVSLYLSPTVSTFLHYVVHYLFTYDIFFFFIFIFL